MHEIMPWREAYVIIFIYKNSFEKIIVGEIT